MSRRRWIPPLWLALGLYSMPTRAETSTTAAALTPCTGAWECGDDVPPLACEWYWRAQCAGYERDLALAEIQTAAERLAVRTPEALAAVAVCPDPPAPAEPLFEVVTAAGAGLGLGLAAGGIAAGGEHAPALALAGGITLGVSALGYLLLR